MVPGGPEIPSSDRPAVAAVLAGVTREAFDAGGGCSASLRVLINGPFTLPFTPGLINSWDTGHPDREGVCPLWTHRPGEIDVAEAQGPGRAVHHLAIAFKEADGI